MGQRCLPAPPAEQQEERGEQRQHRRAPHHPHGVEGHAEQRTGVGGHEGIAVADTEGEDDDQEQHAVDQHQTGKPRTGASTIAPPTIGPMKAPMGPLAFMIENPKARRPRGTRSDRVVIIRPLLPNENPMTARPRVKIHTFGARKVTMPAIR